MHFGSELPSESDFGYQISRVLVNKIWEADNEEFRPINTIGDQRDLVYILISDSSDGFGVVLLRNRSFRKKFNVIFPHFNYSKKNIYLKSTSLSYEIKRREPKKNANYFGMWRGGNRSMGLFRGW